MKKINNLKRWAILIPLCCGSGCEDFLNTRPYGTTTLQTLSSQTGGAEALLIAAYSNLAGTSILKYEWFGAASNWTFGSIAGGDAYKGSVQEDQKAITQIEMHSTLVTTNDYLEGKWTVYYNGIARANDAIKAFRALNGIAEDFREKRVAEARFLRGYFHSELRKIFGYVPYLDETLEDVRVGNAEDILPKIQEDFIYATAHLPLKQEQPGRITRGAAQAYLGISKMWKKDYSGAKIYFDLVINSGTYHLNETYHENFDAEFRNSPESLLEVQQSVNDGSNGGNGNLGDALNYPHGSGPVGCCGFHQPSQNLVNAFQTDSNGLPLLDSFNATSVTNDDGLSSSDSFTPHAGTLDPRLDWTVGRRGIPYLDWGRHPGRAWIRDQVYGGPYSPIKTIFRQSQSAAYSESSWSVLNANNLKLLRYADLLLYAAEAEVELGNLATALEYVNQIRRRAANPAGFVMDGSVPAANYFIMEYPPFPDKDYAIKAVRFERRLELGMEGHRFFDLVRWGIAAEEKNAYFLVEKTKRTYLIPAHFESGKNEVFPIPQKAIDLSYKDGRPTLNQNPGYN